MLELRPRCECCEADLSPDSDQAYICTFECTFCAACANARLHFECPNCGGELVRRPIRPAEKLASLPIACTLTPDEVASMREGLLPGLLARASSKEAMAGGFRWRFEHQSGLLTDAAAVIDAEHHCCRFLRFVLVVEPGDGPVWLEVTGPVGTEEYLSTLVAMMTETSEGS